MEGGSEEGEEEEWRRHGLIVNPLFLFVCLLPFTSVCLVFFSSVSFVLVCFPLSCTRLYSLPLIKSLSLGVFASPFMLCSLLSLPFHFNSSSFLFPLSHIQLFISLFPSLLPSPSRFCLHVFCDASFFFRHLLYHVCSRSPSHVSPSLT